MCDWLQARVRRTYISSTTIFTENGSGWSAMVIGGTMDSKCSSSWSMHSVKDESAESYGEITVA